MLTYKQKGNISVSYEPLINPLQFLRHNMPDKLIKRNAAGMWVIYDVFIGAL